MSEQTVEVEQDDRRGDIAAVMNEALGGEKSAPEPVAAPVEDVVAKDAPPQETAEAKAQRERDEGGRFAKAKDKPAEAAPTPKSAPAGAQAGATAPPASVPEKPAEVQAPRAWKPLGREVWAKVPPEAQREIIRREHETTQVLQQANEHRQTAEAFRQAVAPYEAVFRREGVDAMRGIASLLPAVQALQEGTQERKAQVLAQIVKAYGVDIQALDAALAGNLQPQSQQQIDPRQLIAQAKQEFAQEFAQRQQQYLVERESRNLESIASEMEFLEPTSEPGNVRDRMAKLLEHGLANDFKDAYEKVCRMDPEIHRVLQQRELAANAPGQSTQRAKHASSSVRTTPAGVQPPTQTDGSIRGDLEAVFRDAAGRR